MLIPKKVKHRKWQRGRSKKRIVETRGLKVSYGSVGLKAMSPAWMDGKQLESARKTITNFLKREGKVWIRVFPDKPGRILFEVDGVPKETATKALKLAGYKLPVRTKVVYKD